MAPQPQRMPTDRPEHDPPTDPTRLPDGGKRTSSGRRMPGVPKRTDDPDETATGQGRVERSHQEPAEAPTAQLTTAITRRALERCADPAAVIEDAKEWSDWVGLVDETGGPDLQSYIRRAEADVDFFNDVSQGPAERLAKIDADHHFYAERRVLVGLDEEADWAEAAGWEFQPFEEVAASAGWALAAD